MLASCHTVTSSFDDLGRTKYTASSPDEFAIVNFAKFSGAEFIKTEKYDKK